jgi:hypothetical protein
MLFARFVSKFALSAVALAALATGVRAEDGEENVPLDKLPAKVVEAVKAKWPKGEMLSASKETEDGKTFFEVRLKDGDAKLEVILTEAGVIDTVEKAIAAKDLPKKVADAIAAKYPKSTTDRAEELTHEGKTTYEVLLTLEDKSRVEVSLDPDGKVLEEEKKGKDGDEDGEKKNGK